MKLLVVLCAFIAVALAQEDDIVRIVGGTTAQRGQYPWQISLKQVTWSGTRRHICGGSVLNNNWVITAAHCVQPNPSPSAYVVTVGEHSLAGVDAGEQHIKVSQVIIHESYNSRNFNNDVALLRLATPIQQNQYIAPIALASQSPADGSNCRTSGWGNLRHQGTGPDLLQHVGMPIVNQATCQRAYSSVNQVSSVMICSGHMGGGQGVCQGDSGGPLVCDIGGRPVLVGVTSWGVGCADRNYPGVFARVSSFYTWINNRIGSGYY